MKNELNIEIKVIYKLNCSNFINKQPTFEEFFIMSQKIDKENYKKLFVQLFGIL